MSEDPTIRIDFSMLSAAKKPSSRLRDILLAFGIVCAILSILGLGALLTNNSSNRDTIMAVIAGLMTLGFVITIGIVILLTLAKLQSQKRNIQQFAINNGWKFNGTRRTLTPAHAAPQSITTANQLNTIRYSITGTIKSIQFEVLQLAILTPRMSLLDETGKSINTGLLTVLSLPAHTPINKDASMLYDQDAMHTYVILPSTMHTAEDAQKLFKTFI